MGRGRRRLHLTNESARLRRQRTTGCDGDEPDVLPGPPAPDNPSPASAPPRDASAPSSGPTTTATLRLFNSDVDTLDFELPEGDRLIGLLVTEGVYRRD
jgi:hypothetical protein